MIGLPIDWILALIIGMCTALVAFTIYMVLERNREQRRKLLAAAYLERNLSGWYEYLRTDGVSEEEFKPKNSSEVIAIEELFRTLVHNLKGDNMDVRISGFANRHLAEYYRKKLKGHNWGERMNALFRIHDFGIHSLAEECRELSGHQVSEEEFFLLLLVELKFNPESFLNHNLHKLHELSENDVKELLFGMPDTVFEETVNRMEELDRNVQYAIVDVIGMKLDAKWVPEMEELFISADSELRIRILRAYNLISILPSEVILAEAVTSNVWQERYQTARLLRLLPRQEATQLARKLDGDEVFLIREEARTYKTAITASQDAFSQAAADTVGNEKDTTASLADKKSDSADKTEQLFEKGGD